MKLIKYLLLVLAATLMFASCKSAKTVANLERAIPNDASFVVSFNNKQMVGKGGLDKYKDFNLYSVMRKEIANESEKLVKMFDEFMADTRTSGLNLDQSYIYGVSKKDESFNVVFLFKIDNVKTFEAKLKEMMNPENESENEPQSKNNYKQLELDGSTNVLWNDDKLYIVTGNYNWDEEPIDYSYLFAENAENISLNPDFIEFMKKGYDVGFWASYDRIVSLFDKYSGLFAATSLKNFMVFDAEGMFLHAYLNFENGEAKSGGMISPKGKLDEILKKYPIKKDFDNSLLKYFPEKSYSVMKLSMNVQEYIRMLKDQVAKVNEAYKKEKGGDEEKFDYYYYNPFAEIGEALEDPTVKTIIEGLGGDMLISMYDFQQGMIPMPMAGLAFTVKDKKVFDVILALIPKEVAKENKGYYAFMAGPMPIAYAAYKNNVIYVTTDEKAVEAFLNKGFDKNLNHSEFAKDLKSDVFFWNLNLDLSSYPTHIAMLLRNQMGRDFKILEAFMNIYKSVDYTITKDNEIEFIVKMQSNNNNSLKIILKNLDENISSMMGTR